MKILNIYKLLPFFKRKKIRTRTIVWTNKLADMSQFPSKQIWVRKLFCKLMVLGHPKWMDLKYQHQRLTLI